MTLVIDEALPVRTAGWLREHGIDASHVVELDMRGASDEQIVAYAAEHDAAIVTLDSDFHKILARSQAVKPSVIRIRSEGLSFADAGAMIQRIVSEVADDLAAGIAVSVNDYQMRVRRLPLDR